jgi:chromate transport protein ChrA
MNRSATPFFRKEYFLFLLPLFFVLHGYVENFRAVPEFGALWLAIKYIISGFLIAFLFFLFFRSWRKAAVFSFCVLAFDFFFGTVHDSVKKIFPGSLLTKYSFILPAAFVLLIVLFIFLKRANRSFDRFTKYLNILLLILIIIDLSQLLSKILNQRSEKHSALVNNMRPCDSCSKPDVYLIIADEYAGRQELKDQFGFDNSAFESELTSRGFHVVLNSSANYNFTPYAMGSLLSMDYLANIDSYVSSRKGLNTAYNAINRSAVVDLFKALGYKFVNNSIFRVDGMAAKTEQGALTDKESLITNQTFTSRLYRDIGYHLVTTLKITSVTRKVTYTDQRNNDLLISDLLAQSADTQHTQPRFIYTHLMMPHYPYYVNEKGEPNPLDSITEGNQDKMNYYLEYLKYCNKQFLKIIDQLLSGTNKRAIVIFMSDHGFRELPASVDHRYQFMNLNAIFLPDKNYAPFHDSMSNVNQFRVLFNAEFGQKLPLLKDSTIFLEEK